jgi:murein DD-endopeptidase / murein LD-carboxypeptidase
MFMNYIEKRLRLIIIMIAVSQLLTISCSKKLHTKPHVSNTQKQNEIPITRESEKVAAKNLTERLPETPVNWQPAPELKSFPGILDRTEEEKLRRFLEAGSEKPVNIKNASPDDIIKTAGSYLGVPYCMGGTTSKCLDCSGLLVTVFARHGINLPHNSEEQARYGKMIMGINDLRKGDLVFFIRSYKTPRLITHSGIYIGDNKFIHTSSRNGVSITSLDDSWWNKKFLFGTRVFQLTEY